MKNTNAIGVLVAVVVVIAAAVFLFSKPSAPAATTTTTIAATTSISSAGGQQTINLTETEYSITPNVIYAAPGKKVVLQVTNAGRVDHSISVIGQGLSVTLMPQLIAPGRTARLNFTVPASAGAIYTFFCPVPGHEDLGMKGTLIAQAAPQPSTVSTAPTSVATTSASTAPTTAASTATTTVPSWG